MGRACSVHGENKNACTILEGKPEGKKPLGRPRRRWENIKINNIKDSMGRYGLG
jgi:hypothetical protein